jgi:hypothetical protein
MTGLLYFYIGYVCVFGTEINAVCGGYEHGIA